MLSVAENNGQAIRASFKLRERLYFVKEHSLHVTQDDGTNEPSLWSVSEVSRRVGTPSVRGVGFGEDWVVIAHRTGFVFICGWRADEDFPGDSADVEPDQLAVRADALGDGGHKGAANLCGRAIWERDFAESRTDAGLSRSGFGIGY